MSKSHRSTIFGCNIKPKKNFVFKWLKTKFKDLSMLLGALKGYKSIYYNTVLFLSIIQNKHFIYAQLTSDLDSFVSDY